MANLDFAYPSVLTKKGWDKKKGIVAKIAVGKTDVGKALTELEQEIKRSGFTRVKPFGGKDPAAYLEWEKGLVDGLKTGATAIKAKIKAAKTAATSAHTALQNKKGVPKSSSKYAKSIVDALPLFKTSVEQFPATVKPEVRKDFRKKLRAQSTYLGVQGTSENAATTYQKLMALIKQVEADPTIAKVHNTFGADGPHRQLTTACQLWDQLVARNWPKLAASIYSGKAMSDYFTLPGLKEIANEANSDASKVLKKLVKAGKTEDRAVTTFMLQYSKSVMKANEILKHSKAVMKAAKSI